MEKSMQEFIEELTVETIDELLLLLKANDTETLNASERIKTLTILLSVLFSQQDQINKKNIGKSND